MSKYTFKKKQKILTVISKKSSKYLNVKCRKTRGRPVREEIIIQITG